MAHDDELIAAFEQQRYGAGDMLRIVMEDWPLERQAALSSRIVQAMRDCANELETFLRNEESLRRLRDEAADKESD